MKLNKPASNKLFKTNGASMATILSDKEIEKLINHSIIFDADNNQVRSNSYEFRLGKDVHFFSTHERASGNIGDILEINAGDSAQVTSVETVNFSQNMIDKIYKGQQICAILTPSTTLIREAMELPTTKIDPGFEGTLNWTIRNNSVGPIKLELGEPIFKATFFLLAEDGEIPKQIYGQRKDRDYYHKKNGLVPTKRRLPVDVDKRNKLCVSSKGTEIDRLKQCGFPYDFIATSLEQIGSDLKIVTQDWSRLDKSIENRFNKFEQKILDNFNDKITPIKGKIDNIIFRKLVVSWVTVFGFIFSIITLMKTLVDFNKAEWIAPLTGGLALLCFLILVIILFMFKPKDL